MAIRIAGLFLVTILTAGSAMAQPSSVSFGLKGGVNMARMDYQAVAPDPEPYFLPVGGITLGTSMHPNIGFDVDLLFVRKGVKDEWDAATTFTFRADYAVVSPMLRISPGRGGGGVYFLGGAEIGYLIQAEMTLRAAEEEVTEKVEDGVAAWDYGVTFGMGFQTAPAGQSSFFLESRYVLGLANVDEIQRSEYKSTTQGIYFLGGLRF